jgi:hypothetical protein
MEVLAVGSVDRTAVLQALEDYKGRVEEGHGEQDQGQHEGHYGGRLDGRLDGDHPHQEAEQVGAAIPHEARRGWKVVHEETKRGAGRERREHSWGGPPEVERDDRKRARDDHIHTRREPVHAIGEVDDVHHRDEPDHSESRPRVCGACFGEGERPHERQRDRLHDYTEVHDNHCRRDLAGELDDWGQVVAIVERPHDGDEGSGDQHPMP